MRFIEIDDLDDPRIAIYRSLKATNATRDLGLFVLEGEKLLDVMLESAHFPLVSVLATDRRAGDLVAKVPEGVPLYVVRHERIAELVGYHFHRGVLCCGRRVEWPPVESLAERALAARGALTVVACPGIQNPENLGAIIRLCDVFGVDFLLLDGSCPDPLSRRVARVSMGTALRVPVCVEDELEAVVSSLAKRCGIEWIAAVTDRDAEPLARFARPDRLGLVFGSEGEGLSREWVARCSRRVTINMREGAESLNLAVAAGIVLYFTMKDLMGGRG
jgi:tRNA G18 (ribose-2'-O)-methylase SpoU